MKIRSKWLAAGAAGAMILAACGGTTTNTTDPAAQIPTTQTPTTQSPTTQSPSTTDAPVADGPVRFSLEIANISDGFLARQAEVFAVPLGADEPGPALPGTGYEWTFAGVPGERLSFATMFVQSNDWFFAPDPEGIALFDAAGDPTTGDITADVSIWDAGTEVDQEPGAGADQAPRQSGPDTGGVDNDSSVRQVDRDAAAYIAVSLSHDAGQFTLTIENVSEGASVPTPLAPGVGVVHTGGEPVFSVGEADRGYGLEALAEDGAAADLADFITQSSGVATPLAPGVVVALDDGQVLFTSGSPDNGLGLEGLAEDGAAGPLGEETGGIVFAIPGASTEPGPLFPGDSYIVEFEATPGQQLSFATMLVQSNDWFFAPAGDGIALWDADGTVLAGNITDSVSVWDAGTEADQAPGLGPDQAPRQSGPNTGDADTNESIRVVSGFNAADYIVVTLTQVG